MRAWTTTATVVSTERHDPFVCELDCVAGNIGGRVLTYLSHRAYACMHRVLRATSQLRPYLYMFRTSAFGQRT